MSGVKKRGSPEAATANGWCPVKPGRAQGPSRLAALQVRGGLAVAPGGSGHIGKALRLRTQARAQAQRGDLARGDSLEEAEDGLVRLTDHPLLEPAAVLRQGLLEAESEGLEPPGLRAERTQEATMLCSRIGRRAGCAPPSRRTQKASRHGRRGCTKRDRDSSLVAKTSLQSRCIPICSYMLAG